MNVFKAINEAVEGPQILNEGVFFGKTPEVMELEKLCTDYLNTSLKLNTIEWRKKFEKVIIDLVNCEACCVDTNSYSYSTSFPTMKITDASFYMEGNKQKPRLITTPAGIKFRNPKGKTILINMPHLNMEGLTGPELCAVLLHEIGHNMDIQDTGRYLFLMCTIMPPFGIYFLAKERLETLSRKYLFGLPVINHLSNFISAFINVPSQFFSNMGEYINKFLPDFLKLKEYISPKTWFYLLLGFNDERYADSFAAAYGYTNELYSALSKFKKKDFEKSVNTLPLMKLFTFSGDIFNNVFLMSPHMNNINRLANNISYLQSCMDEIKDPRMKKILQKELKVTIDTLKAISKDDSESIYNILVSRYMIKKDKISAYDFRVNIWDNITGADGYQRSLKEFTKRNE